jgi:hypothetical protein
LISVFQGSPKKVKAHSVFSIVWAGRPLNNQGMVLTLGQGLADRIEISGNDAPADPAAKA